MNLDSQEGERGAGSGMRGAGVPRPAPRAPRPALFAIAGLTWKSAFRYRLFWVLAVLLIAAVVVLPLIIKDDGSAQGLMQILLTYTLSAITALLGFSTLWLSCGSLARDIEDCQMQVVVTKPVARWQIWLGKWLGIAMLNVALLAISGGCVFFLIQWRAAHLTDKTQQAKLHREFLVARASLKEREMDLNPEIEARFQDIIKDSKINPTNYPGVRAKIKEAVLAEMQVVPSGMVRRWEIDVGTALRDKLKGVPLQARIKFHSANPLVQVNGLTYLALWQIGASDSPNAVRLPPQYLPPDSFQEFTIPPDLIDKDGKLTIEFHNRNDEALFFSLSEGMEVLYPESSFGLNFVRGLGIILCWLLLLSTIGLATASWLSFPVAAFCSLSLLLVGLSSGTLSIAIDQGTIFGINHETGASNTPHIDSVLMPVFKGALWLVKRVEGFSPIDSLSSGRSITWGQLSLAVTQIVLIMGGIFAIAGIIFFTRRELAASQGDSL